MLFANHQTQEPSGLSDKAVGAVAPPGPTTVHGYKKLEDPAELRGVTPFAFTTDEDCDLGRSHGARVPYLEALRGLIAFEVCLWAFFRILAPAIVADTDEFNVRPAPFLEVAPQWHSTVRMVFQPLLWDGSLQTTFFFILSARVCAQTFIERRNSVSLAGAVFRRPLRMYIPLAFALAAVTIMSSCDAFDASYSFAGALNNSFANPAPKWKSVLNFLASFTAYVFDNSNEKNSVPMEFFPPKTVMWTITRIFIQSFTVYTFAVMLPYIRTAPKFIFGGIFWLWSWWLGNFAYYSLTGLLLAELVVVYDLPSLTHKRILNIVPAWTVPAFFLAVGVLIKYLVGDAFPNNRNEWVAHDDSQTGLAWYGFDPSAEGYPRVDDWLVAANTMVLIEMFASARAALECNPVLIFLGRISYSLFLVEGAIFQSLGPIIWQHMSVAGHDDGSAAIIAAQFFSCVPLALIIATVFHVLIEVPTDICVRKLFVWLIEE